MEWISVKDKLPECDEITTYITCELTDSPINTYVDVREFMPGTKTFQLFCHLSCTYEVDDAVTHWMPLPEPPKEGK